LSIRTLSLLSGSPAFIPVLALLFLDSSTASRYFAYKKNLTSRFCMFSNQLCSSHNSHRGCNHTSASFLSKF
jgi:hypothetical protein